MQIKFTGQYKSITSFESLELADFVVLTGKNGTGKTQLIEAIREKFSNSQNTHTYSVETFPTLQNPQFGGIEIVNGQVVSNRMWEDKARSIINSFTSLPLEAKKQIQILLDNGLTYATLMSDQLNIDNLFIDYNQSPQHMNSLRITWNLNEIHLLDPKNFVPNIKSALIKKLRDLGNAIFISHSTAQYKKKELINIEENDYFSTPIDELKIENNFVFNISIESVFFNYARKRNANEFANFRKREKGIDNNSISDDEFIKQFPPPWDIVNAKLTSLGLPYKVPVIDSNDFTNEYNYHFHLLKGDNNQRIEFANLSSGEKIIIGLILKLFLSSTYKNNLKYPDYLFLDEPDAHLHPEMSKLLIDVLYNTFVKELGIKVVITTHSPSTVALAPEESIYELTNSPKTSIKKIDKDEALKILTDKLPTLNIDYRNHRHVFVESPVDQYYYASLFNKLITERSFIHNLYFISNSLGKGNCDQVKKVVEDLRAAGNQTAFGIIDWDNTATSSMYIKVHGEKQRYSIENYLLDPLYLVAFCVENKLANNVRELGFDEFYTLPTLANEPVERLQAYADWVINRIYSVKPVWKQSATINISYLNGKTILLPAWYRDKRGHDLYEVIKECFTSIKNQNISEPDFEKKMVQVLIKSFPLVPVDTVNLLRELAVVI